MSDPILPLLVAILAALLVCGGLGAFLPGNARQAIGFAAAGIGGLGCLLSLLSVLAGEPPAAIDLPVGPPGTGLHLALDPLSAFFLLFIFLGGTVSLAFTTEAPQSDPTATLAGLAACLAGLVLTLLAADGIALALGLALAGGSIWTTGAPSRPRARQLGVSLGAAVLLLIAVTLLDPTDIAPHFEAIRSTPTASKDTAAAMILTVLGAGTLAGLVPLHGWLVPAHAAAPPRGAAALSGGLVPVAIYLLLRIVVDLTGGTPPFWWGLPFLLMGAASAVLGGWRAATELRIDRVVAAATPRSAGLAAIGVGLMLFGRGADLPSLTALALAAVLLLSAGQSICATLMMLTSGAVQQSAGTNRLDRLGGLLHRMPMASIALASGVFGLAGLPPGIAFAGTWLLFQALLAAPRAGGLAPQILLAGLAAALALSAALAASAAVRLLGVACLGRPRTPRAAAAGDIPSRTRPPLLTLSVLGLLLGLLPGVVLWLLANPAILLLTGTSLGSRAGVLGLAPGAETPGYAALPLAALIALCGGATVWFIRRRSRPERSSPAWHDGFAPPPAWLPFGDPLDQTDGSGFVPELPAPPDRRRWPDWRPMTRVVAPQAAALWAVLVIIGALLAMLTILGPA